MQITAVIVLYKQELTKSPSYISLMRIVDLLPIAKLLIYDNSPSPQKMPPSSLPLLYCHDKENKGLVPAYNKAANIAQENNSHWVLLLDQDTHFNESFAHSLLNTQNQITTKTAFICPRILSANRQISPVRVFKGMALSKKPITKSGRQQKGIMAINSACLVKVDFLQEIGLYPTSYTLEYVDHWFCREAYKRGYHGLVTDEIIEHDLSLSAIEKNISHARYEKILAAEQSFHKDNSLITQVLYLLSLTRRYLYFRIKLKDKKYAKMVLKQFFHYFH